MEGERNAPPAALGCAWGAGAGEAEMEVLRSLPVVFSRAPDYFSAYLGEYRNVLSALETLNAAVLAAMDKTKLVRTGPGAGSRAGGIGAVVSTAASSCEVWGSEAANPSNQGGAWACSGCLRVRAVLQAHSLEDGEPSPRRGRVNPKLLCSGDIISLLARLWQWLFQQLLAGSCPRTLCGSIPESPC